jgi:hypothetical protein
MKAGVTAYSLEAGISDVNVYYDAGTVVAALQSISQTGPGGVDVTAISLWDNKANAETYNTNGYPEVLKTMQRFIEGTPKVQTSDVVNSTFHSSAVHATA